MESGHWGLLWSLVMVLLVSFLIIRFFFFGFFLLLGEVVVYVGDMIGLGISMVASDGNGHVVFRCYRKMVRMITH